MRELLPAPWSNQPVRGFVRGLAWVFVACGAFVIGFVVYLAFTEGFPTNLPFGAYAVFGGTVYVVALFLAVAIRGKAPSGWLPWS